MWKLLFAIALPLVPLAAAHDGAPERTGSLAQPQVTCLIRPEGTASGVNLEGVVDSLKPLSGNYRFEVRKRGPAGTSTSSQSGAFESRPEESVVAVSAVGLERGASYEAELMLKWKTGETSCVARGPGGK